MVSWERLEKIIQWAGLSTHAFAMKIGMKRSENLYRIIRNKENVSIKVSTLIFEAYPEINRNWLIYGEGEMINKQSADCAVGNDIPFYAASIDGLEGKANLKPAYTLNLPMFQDIDLAVANADAACEKLIPVGTTMLLKKQSVKLILFGQLYYVETKNISMVRIVRADESNPNNIILESCNTERYDNINISKGDIVNLYLICGTVNRFF